MTRYLCAVLFFSFQKSNKEGWQQDRGLKHMHMHMHCCSYIKVEIDKEYTNKYTYLYILYLVSSIEQKGETSPFRKDMVLHDGILWRWWCWYR